MSGKAKAVLEFGNSSGTSGTRFLATGSALEMQHYEYQERATAAEPGVVEADFRERLEKASGQSGSASVTRTAEDTG